MDSHIYSIHDALNLGKNVNDDIVTNTNGNERVSKI